MPAAAARTIRTHRCHGRHGCTAEVPMRQLMCRACWALVPAARQQALYATWDGGRGRGTLEHLEAMMACQRAVNA